MGIIAISGNSNDNEKKIIDNKNIIVNNKNEIDKIIEREQQYMNINDSYNINNSITSYSNSRRLGFGKDNNTNWAPKFESHCPNGTCSIGFNKINNTISDAGRFNLFNEEANTTCKQLSGDIEMEWNYDENTWVNAEDGDFLTSDQSKGYIDKDGEEIIGCRDVSGVDDNVWGETNSVLTKIK